MHVRFSNRPIGVKHFQTIHTPVGPSIMGFVITLYAFTEADRRPINARRLSVFTATLVVFAGGIALIFAAQRLAPHPRLCDLCLQSIPHIQFGRELRARFGPADAAHPH